MPILVLGFGAPIPYAIGASAAALFPAALFSTFFNVRKHLVDIPLVVLLEVPTMMGVYLGAYLTNIVPIRTLECVFSLFVFIIAFQMYRQSGSLVASGGIISWANNLGPRYNREKDGKSYSVGIAAAGILGSLTGVVAGMFGVGGGILKMPVMLGAFRIPPQVAVATSLCGIVTTSLVATVSHASLGHIKPLYIVPTVIGFILGALIGNILIKHRIGDMNLKKLVAGSLALAGVMILIHVFFIKS